MNNQRAIDDVLNHLELSSQVTKDAHELATAKFLLDTYRAIGINDNKAAEKLPKEERLALIKAKLDRIKHAHGINRCIYYAPPDLQRKLHDIAKAVEDLNKKVSAAINE